MPDYHHYNATATVNFDIGMQTKKWIFLFLGCLIKLEISFISQAHVYPNWILHESESWVAKMPKDHAAYSNSNSTYCKFLRFSFALVNKLIATVSKDTFLSALKILFKKNIKNSFETLCNNNIWSSVLYTTIVENLLM